MLRYSLAKPGMNQTDTPSARALLQAHGERITAAREAVLGILLETPSALTHPDIESAARSRGLNADRVTIYRVLDWLVAQGLAHRIAGEDRVWRFNAVTRGNHGHAHFHCSRCGQVYCLNDLKPVFSLSLPEGFRFESAELSIQGICARCTCD